MADPFGALAMQKTGDTGVFNGHQYIPSSQLDRAFPTTFGNGIANLSNTAPSMLQVLDGSAANPTTQAKPSARVDRTELISSSPNTVDPEYNAGLEVMVKSVTNNVVQSTAVYAVTSGYAGSGILMVPLYGRSDHTGGATGGATGAYLTASSTVAGGAIFAVATNISNATGASITSASGSMAVLDLAAAANNSDLHGSAIQIRSTGGGGYDKAIYLNGPMVIGFDMSNATCSTYAADFRGTNNAPTTDAGGMAHFFNQAAQGAGVGGRILMGGKYTNAGAYAEFGAIAGEKVNGTTGNFAGRLAFYTRGNGTGSWGSFKLMISDLGSIVCGAAAIATTATDAFLYIPTCAGTPTGTPTTQTGTAAMVFDSSNNKLYVYGGGAWNIMN